jgi:hypothetical protein
MVASVSARLARREMVCDWPGISLSLRERAGMRGNRLRVLPDRSK